MNPTLANLIEDINGLRDTIRYCENRIERKIIAIDEIIASQQTRAVGEPEMPKVPEMLLEYIGTVNGDNFDRQKAQDFLEARWPAFRHAPSAKDQVRLGLHKLVKSGHLNQQASGIFNKNHK